jgi:hypothetical protein
MPASSLRQKHFFSMVKGIQMGKLSPSKLPVDIRAKVTKTAKNISTKSASDFANKVEEGDIDFSVLSFKEYMVVENTLVSSLSSLPDSELNALIERYTEDLASNKR